MCIVNICYPCLTVQNTPNLLKILVAPDDGICTPEIIPFSVYGGISTEYIVMFLKSPYVDGLVNGETYGIKMPRAGTETMVNLLFPLPPLAEQKRIVTKIEELMRCCRAGVRGSGLDLLGNVSYKE